MILYLLLCVFFWDSFAKQNVLDPTISFNAINNQILPLNDPVLTQMIVFFRHGHYTHGSTFYDGEYNAFDADVSKTSEATYLGNSQAWSFGSTLRANYPYFFDSLTSPSDYLYVVGNYERSISNAEHLSCGLMKNYPNWDYENLQSRVLLAVKKNGYCEGCDEGSSVPILSLAKISLDNTTEIDSPEFEIHEDSEFIDVTCDYLTNKFLEFVDELSNYILDEFSIDFSEEELSKKNGYIEASLTSPIQNTAEYKIDILTMIYESHIAHELVDLTFEEDKINEFLGNNPYLWLYEEKYKYIFDDEVDVGQIYNNYLLKSLKDKISWYSTNESKKKFITYIVHDNNLYSMISLLNGQVEEYPYYSGNLLINIYETNTDSGSSYYVNIVYNGYQLDIQGCDHNCPLDEFYSIIEANIIDLGDYCSEY